MTENDAAELTAEPTWVDAFPWIEANGVQYLDIGLRGPWQRQPISRINPAEQREIIARLSAIALERLPRWTLGQLLPTLPGNLPLSILPFNRRAQNALARDGMEVTGDLQALELTDLLGMPNLGIGTVDLMLRVMGQAAAQSAVPALQGLSLAEAALRPAAPPQHNAGVEAVVENLRAIARWQVASGTEDQSLLASALPPGTPSAIIEVRQRLVRLQAVDVLDGEETQRDAGSLLARSISLLDERQQTVLRRRLFAERPETLDRIGLQLDVTRERVRQIESTARCNMVQLIQSGGTLELVAQGVRDLVATVLPLVELLEHMPALGRTVDLVGQPVWRILDRLDDSYEIVDGWCASPTVGAARAGTEARLQELASPYGVVPIDELRPLNPHLSANRGDVLIAWLRYCGYELHDAFVLLRTQALGDRAAAILSIVGAPMSADEVLARLNIQRSVGSLRNAMAADERIERVDRDTWALVEWGLDAYIGVRALVKDELARSGGQVSLDELVERITGKYSVRASSVISYASAPPFEARGGVVRLRSTPDSRRKTPQETRRLYRRDGEWLYRVEINSDHLRGSGTVAPMAITTILDLGFGDTRTLESPIGTQVISWTALQPAFGSIRRLLIHEDIAAGSEVFLIIGDDCSFWVERVPPLRDDALADALILVGSYVCKGDIARHALAAAIGLDDSVSFGDIFAAYRSRGDGDVAEFLLASRDELFGTRAEHEVVAPPEINEILGLLHG
jgi:hypothetical protein